MSKSSLPKIDINSIQISELKNFTIETKVGKADGKNFGRSFTLVRTTDGTTSEEVIFKDIFKHVRDISKKAATLKDFMDIKDFLSDLYLAEAEAGTKYKKTGRFYRFLTSISRFPGGGKPHMVRLDKLINKINETYPKVIINELKGLDKGEIKKLHKEDSDACFAELVRGKLDEGEPWKASEYFNDISDSKVKEDLAIEAATILATRPRDDYRNLPHKASSSCRVALKILIEHIKDDDKRDEELLKFVNRLIPTDAYGPAWVIGMILFVIKSEAVQQELMKAILDKMVMACTGDAKRLDDSLVGCVKAILVAVVEAYNVSTNPNKDIHFSNTINWIKLNVVPLCTTASQAGLSVLFKSVE